MQTLIFNKIIRSFKQNKNRLSIIRKEFKKVIAVIFFATLFASMFQNINIGTAEAASEYISVEAFCKYIAKEISVAASGGKRISDISKVEESKRADVAKAYLKVHFVKQAFCE